MKLKRCRLTGKQQDRLLEFFVGEMTAHTAAYFFGGVCPKQGKGASLVLPFCNSAAMRQVTSFVISPLMGALRFRLSLQLVVAALRHRLSVYQGMQRRPLITPLITIE